MYAKYGLRPGSWLLPPLCASCQTVLDHPGLCHTCWADLQLVEDPACPHCDLPLEHALMPCPECLRMKSERRRLHVRRIKACFRYQTVGRNLVLRLKHGDATNIAPTLARMMGRRLWNDLPAETLIIPVPLHPLRGWQRRYNQAGLLADHLAREKGFAVHHDLLLRWRKTANQGKFGRSQRFRNLQGAFHIRDPKALLPQQSVLLVDDVMTTGATLTACAASLKRAGALAVDALVLARVWRDS
ncbi:MAG: ComF family protein [Pseudomonadota bacterium]